MKNIVNWLYKYIPIILAILLGSLVAIAVVNLNFAVWELYKLSKTWDDKFTTIMFIILTVIVDLAVSWGFISILKEE